MLLAAAEEDPDMWELNSLAQYPTEHMEMAYRRCGFPVGENTCWDLSSELHQVVLLSSNRAKAHKQAAET